jgi:hypothetical protein
MSADLQSCRVVGVILTRSEVTYPFFQRLMLLPPSFIPLIETDTYDQLPFRLMYPCEVSAGSPLARKNGAIFGNVSVDYGPKSRC